MPPRGFEPATLLMLDFTQCIFIQKSWLLTAYDTCLRHYPCLYQAKTLWSSFLSCGIKTKMIFLHRQTTLYQHVIQCIEDNLIAQIFRIAARRVLCVIEWEKSIWQNFALGRSGCESGTLSASFIGLQPGSWECLKLSSWLRNEVVQKNKCETINQDARTVFKDKHFLAVQIF